MQVTELAIIGAGTAGLTAAAIAAARGVSVLVIEHLAPGGQIATVEKIRNMPGFPEGIGGYELGPLLQQQAEEAGCEFLFDTAERIVPDDAGFAIHGSETMVRATAVILAMGSQRRILDVPGEKAFEGRGVSHCASCDGHFFRGKAVVVAGGGDSAFDEAEVLAEHAGQVTILYRGAQPRAQAATVARVSALPNVRLLPQTEIRAIEGAGEVERLVLEGPAGRSVEPAAGLFVYTGLVPRSELAAGLAALDARGAIQADGGFQTTCPGLFVAGDLRSGATSLLASLAGDGAAAAIAAVDHIRATARIPMETL